MLPLFVHQDLCLEIRGHVFLNINIIEVLIPFREITETILFWDESVTFCFTAVLQRGD